MANDPDPNTTLNAAEHPKPAPQHDPFATTRLEPPPPITTRTVTQNEEQQSLAADRSAPPPTLPGYAIHAEIGRGGMGVVYRATQLKANRTVALKMILGGGHASQTELERFKNEIEATARLKHPGIVHVYEVGDYDGLPYFSMELCDGGSLAKAYGGQQHSPRVAAAVVERLAHAVEAAHLAGIVHRDLKPSNILICEGQPKVGDFGLAKKLDSAHGHTRSGAIMGTPNYMAPEQAAGKAKAVGPPADVYALGVMLYELLTGQLPFAAEHLPELLQKVMHDEPPPISNFRDDVPRDLVTITMKCLAKEPGRRYATAGELAEDLRRFQSGESIAAQQLGFIERVAWMLEKSQHDMQFAHLAVCFFWFAPLFLVPELLAALAKYWYPTALTWPWWVYAGYVIRLVTGVGMFMYYSHRVWPTNPAEQHIVSVGGAFVFSAILLTLNMDELTGVSKYQALASMSGLAFVSLGAMFWGRFYLIGLAFLMLVPLMLMCRSRPWLVPLLYGVLWSVVSLTIGFRLRYVQQMNERSRHD